MAAQVGFLPCGVCKHPNSLPYQGSQCLRDECAQWDGKPPLRHRLRQWAEDFGHLPYDKVYRDYVLETIIEQDPNGFVDKFGRVFDGARCLRCNHQLDTPLDTCPKCRTCAGNPTLRVAIWHYMMCHDRRSPPPAWYVNEVKPRMLRTYQPRQLDGNRVWEYSVEHNLRFPQRYYELKSEMAAPSPTDDGARPVLQHPQPIRTSAARVPEIDSRTTNTSVTNPFINREDEAPQSLGGHRAAPDDQQQHSGLYASIHADPSKTSAKQGQTSASEHLGMGSSSSRQQQPSATFTYAQLFHSEQLNAMKSGSRTNVPSQSQSNCGESPSAANVPPLPREQARKMYRSPATKLRDSLAPTYIPAEPKPAHTKDICSWKPPAILPQNFHLEGSVQAPAFGEWRVAQFPGLPDSTPCNKCQRHTPRSSAIMPETSSR